MSAEPNHHPSVPTSLSHIVAAGGAEPFILVEFDAGRFPVDKCETQMDANGMLIGIAWVRQDGASELIDLDGAADQALLDAAVREDTGLLVVQVADLRGPAGVVAEGPSFSVCASVAEAPRDIGPGRSRA